MSLNTGYGAKKEADGIIEELFIHEGAHASLDGYHANVILSCIHLNYIIMKSPPKLFVVDYQCIKKYNFVLK